MHVRDLLLTDGLDLRPRVAGGPGRLDRTVSWCAPTELMDPTPFLSGNALVLTHGMGLNFRDPRTWDAYVERLGDVPVSALVVGLGVAHEATPPGLVDACDAHGLPLLELPGHVPLLQVIRHVWQTLGAERHAEMRAGWELADECTRLAAGGASLGTVVERISRVVDARLTVVDSAGYQLVAAGTVRKRSARTTLNLPTGDAHRFRLLIEGMDANVVVHPLLGPVAAVLAMQLAGTLGSNSPMHSREAARFIEALYERRGTTRAQLRALAEDAGFDAATGWGAVVIAAPGDMDAAQLRAISWRVRVELGENFGTARFMEGRGRTTVVVERPTGARPLTDLVRELFREAPEFGVDVLTAGDMDELSLALRLVGRTAEPGVRDTARVDLAAIVDGLPSTGLAAMAHRLLEPLQREPSGTLIRTLDAFLRHSGNTRAVCDELFIHRNTLAYRVRRIEELLDHDLADGSFRATCLLALSVAGLSRRA
ncbi:PucR family transcriptional regulator [Arthrobacter halodurans]|uniref:PucR family transcriptional regulator n=1 Tax=Arthrobacter halodurans TaxID=516699 RepID=A0ABV4UVL2_9MICC